MQIIAHIHTDFKEKFGIPRQSGLVDATRGVIVFEKPFRDPQALRGIEGYSHLWLLWQFSEVSGEGWHATVRPPRLGGNRRMGVFATRSPFRPNPIGLSSVRLLEVRPTPQNGTVLVVAGADLLDGTPIYDIKPYLPFTDCHPDAVGGFADPVRDYRLRVVMSAEQRAILGEHTDAVEALLAQDPRPSYQEDPTRVYGMCYASFSLHFTVAEDVLTVCDIEEENSATK